MERKSRISAKDLLKRTPLIVLGVVGAMEMAKLIEGRGSSVEAAEPQEADAVGPNDVFLDHLFEGKYPDYQLIASAIEVRRSGMEIKTDVAIALDGEQLDYQEGCYMPALGIWFPGDSDYACGKNGAFCIPCPERMTCDEGVCVPKSQPTPEPTPEVRRDDEFVWLRSGDMLVESGEACLVWFGEQDEANSKVEVHQTGICRPLMKSEETGLSHADHRVERKNLENFGLQIRDRIGNLIGWILESGGPLLPSGAPWTR